MNSTTCVTCVTNSLTRQHSSTVQAISSDVTKFVDQFENARRWILELTDLATRSRERGMTAPQEAHRSRPAARRHQRGVGAGEVDPARAPVARCTCGGRGGRWRRRGR